MGLWSSSPMRHDSEPPPTLYRHTVLMTLKMWRELCSVHRNIYFGNSNTLTEVRFICAQAVGSIQAWQASRLFTDFPTAPPHWSHHWPRVYRWTLHPCTLTTPLRHPRGALPCVDGHCMWGLCLLSFQWAHWMKDAVLFGPARLRSWLAPDRKKLMVKKINNCSSNSQLLLG